MGKRLDLTGQRFGRLVALRDVGSDTQLRVRLWECQCDCGNKTIVLAGNLTSGNTTSCGCKGRGTKKGEKRIRIDLTGQRFGNLVAICDVGKDRKYGGRLWECQCDCGKKTIVKAASLRAGDTRSCGCLLKTDEEIAERRALGKLASNKMQKNNTIGARGVYKAWKGKYGAKIMYKGEFQYLGYFDTIEEASEAYKKRKNELIEANKRRYEELKKE